MVSKQLTVSKQHLKNGSTISSGFTLVEMLVVIVIVGVLAAIAAPGWLAFANSRRATTANDQMLQVLRQAQIQATRTRETQTVRFDVAADPPLITYGDASGDQSISVLLGENGSTQGMVGMAAIKNNNSVPDECNSEANCIAFGADGTVLNLIDRTGSDEDEDPIIITVFAPNPQANAKRCVMIESLLGAMRSDSGNNCN